MPHARESSPSSRSSRRLLADAQAGSNEALGTLLQTCRTYLLIIGERELSGAIRARVAPSDVVQETLAEGKRALALFEGQTTEQFTAWLRGILLHKIAHARRFHQATGCRAISREEPQAGRSSICQHAVKAVDDETPSRVAMRAEDADVMHAALARLPAHYRQVIQLRNFDLLQFEDIGLLMERPTGAARALWGRAMQALKEELHGFSAQ